MNPISFLQKRRLLSDYKRIREAGRKLNGTLLKELPKSALLDCAKKLGLRKGKTLIFDNEAEMEVLADYGLYTYRRGGRSIAEICLENSSEETHPEALTFLRSMTQSHYSIFIVQEVKKGQGVTLFDLLRYKEISLLDVGLSTSAVSGLILAGRVLPVEDYYMTSGAFIPLTPDFLERRVLPVMEKFCPHSPAENPVVLSPGQEAAFAGEIIKSALRERQLEMTAYE